MATPNIFNLHSPVIQGGQFSLNVRYSTSEGGAIPGLQYQDPNQVLNFSADNMRSLIRRLGRW
jgi:hypothetical protein